MTGGFEFLGDPRKVKSIGAKTLAKFRAISGFAFAGIAPNDRGKLLEVTHKNHATEHTAPSDEKQRWQSHRDLIDDEGIKCLAVKLVSDVALRERRGHDASLRNDLSFKRIQARL